MNESLERLEGSRLNKRTAFFPDRDDGNIFPMRSNLGYVAATLVLASMTFSSSAGSADNQASSEKAADLLAKAGTAFRKGRLDDALDYTGQARKSNIY